MNTSDIQIGNFYYNPSQILGAGSFGKVYLAYHVDNPAEKYAIKIMSIEEIIQKKDRKKLAIREIEALRSLKSDHIVQLVDLMQTAHNLYIVMEYCEEGDLQDILKNGRTFSEKESSSIVKQIASVFVTVKLVNSEGHQVVVMHRDIKPANILFHEGKVKLADFGFAKMIEDELRDIELDGTILGTQRYSPPQILKGDSYSAKCDVWSTGILFYRILFGGFPWNGSSDTELYKNIQKIPLLFPKEIKEETKDLLRRMLQIEEKDRISWKEVYEHPALKDV